MNNDLSRRLEAIYNEIEKRDNAIEWVKHVAEEDPSKEEASKEEIERLTREKEELEKAKEELEETKKELEETKEKIQNDYSSSDIVIEDSKSTNMWRNFFDNLKSRTSSMFASANSNIDRDAKEFSDSIRHLNEDFVAPGPVVGDQPVEQPIEQSVEQPIEQPIKEIKRKSMIFIKNMEGIYKRH